MKLSDQEQVVLKAIGHGVVEISRVIKAVGYPKATVKKILIGLSNKGVVTLYRHDWAASLTPDQRKLMVRHKGNYYGAVSVRERNPKKTNKGKKALTATGRALKGLARGALSAGAQILGAGATALNPVRRKVKNKYIDLVIRGQAKKTPQGWKVGQKTFAQGRGTVNVSSGYYLDRHTGIVYAKRERNTSVGRKAKRSRLVSRERALKTTAKGRKPKLRSVLKRRNVSEGFYDASGVFHPIRSATDYSPSTAGETGRKAKHTRSRKKLASKRKASATAKHRSVVKTRKSATRRLAGKAIKKSSGLLKKGKKRRNTQRIVNNAKIVNKRAESIRKKFAGRYDRDSRLIFPDGTPQGLAKLGQLVSIDTDSGRIKPVKGTAWLCSDTSGKLHIGTPTKGHVVFGGPAHDFGKVRQVEYKERKPHLGYRNQTIFFHKLGEETGVKPRLVTDGKGGAKFIGGAYKIRREGIIN